MKIPLNRLVENDYNFRLRFDEEEMKILCDSIAKHGQVQPLLIRPIDDDEKVQMFEVVAGIRRFKCLKRLEEEEADCLVKDINDEIALMFSFEENMKRSDLNPIEEAKAFYSILKAKIDKRTRIRSRKDGYKGILEPYSERLKEKYEQICSYSNKEDDVIKLGKETGISRTTISKRVHLLLLPNEVQEAIIEEELNPAKAYQISRLDSLQNMNDDLIEKLEDKERLEDFESDYDPERRMIKLYRRIMEKKGYFTTDKVKRKVTNILDKAEKEKKNIIRLDIVNNVEDVEQEIMESWAKTLGTRIEDVEEMFETGKLILKFEEHPAVIQTKNQFEKKVFNADYEDKVRIIQNYKKSLKALREQILTEEEEKIYKEEKKKQAKAAYEWREKKQKERQEKKKKQEEEEKEEEKLTMEELEAAPPEIDEEMQKKAQEMDRIHKIKARKRAGQSDEKIIQVIKTNKEEIARLTQPNSKPESEEPKPEPEQKPEPVNIRKELEKELEKKYCTSCSEAIKLRCLKCGEEHILCIKHPRNPVLKFEDAEACKDYDPE